MRSPESSFDARDGAQRSDTRNNDTSPENPAANNSVEREDRHNDNDDPTPQIPEPSSNITGWRLIITLLLLSLTAFVVSLDDTIVATAIPRITDDFHSIADVAWYGSAYLLTLGGMQLLFGKLYAIHSDKKIYTGSLCIFITGSTVCGTASSSVVMIFGRALAGVGAAGLVTGALIIIAHSAPLRLRPVYTSIVGSMTAVGSVAGPLLGGVITDRLSWRWCFYINLPIIGTLLALFLFLYRPRRRQQSPSSSGLLCGGSRLQRVLRYDPLGNLAFLFAVVCFQIALQWGGAQFSWHSPRVVALFVSSAVLLMIFAPVEWMMGQHATLNVRIARQRTVASSGALIALLGASYYSAIYYLPLWFQGVQGASPTHSGVLSIALLISMIVSSLLSAGLVSKTGYYNPFALAAPILAACGTGLLTTLEPDSGPGEYIGYQVLLGIGIGCGFHQPFIAVQAVLPEADVASGIGLIMCAEMLGGALGIAVSQKIFENQLVAFVNKSRPEIHASAILQTGATGLAALLPEKSSKEVAKAYSDAVTATFYLAAGLAAAGFVAACFMEWKNIKKTEGDDDDDRSKGEEIEIDETVKRPRELTV
ncbi:related to transporter (major facilitator superfamily) [Ramularia collo-cygni]|uniref:Related to transporter (Major facilitator superfamily) n=1 Tax=Ramularia collo-cygni TaxID=112498 RepID=A0A2D3V797_9PEZI|nr:related to transporter (major facilitator superfamily) [Ramularia collo-cygni]CZT22760.1 related to transporter (major facilitator superfamily) [Ramularia collo-cygni]